MVGNAAVYPKNGGFEDYSNPLSKCVGQCWFQHCCKTWMLNFANLMSRLIPFLGGQLGTCSCHFTILRVFSPRNATTTRVEQIHPWRHGRVCPMAGRLRKPSMKSLRRLEVWDFGSNFIQNGPWVLFQVATAKTFLLESLSWSTSIFLSINLHWTRAGH